MHQNLVKLRNELERGGIHFECVKGAVHIPLPNKFGILEVTWADRVSSIQLLEGTYHTHGEMLAKEYGLMGFEAGIRYLVEKIFDGTFKMVEVTMPDGNVQRKIWDTFSLQSPKEGLDYKFHELT